MASKWTGTEEEEDFREESDRNTERATTLLTSRQAAGALVSIC